MFAWIKELLWDETVFFGALSRVGITAGRLRAFLLTIALGVGTGVGPFAPITQWLGEAGWLGAGVLIVITGWVKAGDPTPPQLKELTSQELDDLVGHVKTLRTSERVAVVAIEPAAPPAVPPPADRPTKTKR